mgnify:CR=1 FL=1
MGFRLFAGLGNVREALNFHARDPPPPLPPPASFFAPTPTRGGGLDWVHELAVVRLSAYVEKDAGAWRTRFDVAVVAPRAWSEDAEGWGRLALSLHWNVGFQVLHPISRSNLRPVEGSPDDVAFSISHEMVHAATAGEFLDYTYHALIVEPALRTCMYLSKVMVAHTLTRTHTGEFLDYTYHAFIVELAPDADGEVGGQHIFRRVLASGESPPLRGVPPGIPDPDRECHGRESACVSADGQWGRGEEADEHDGGQGGGQAGPVTLDTVDSSDASAYREHCDHSPADPGLSQHHRQQTEHLLYLACRLRVFLFQACPYRACFPRYPVYSLFLSSACLFQAYY